MKTEHSLAQLCAALNVKRSGYHAWEQAALSPHERTDAELLPKSAPCMRSTRVATERRASSRNWPNKGPGMVVNALRA